MIGKSKLRALFLLTPVVMLAGCNIVAPIVLLGDTKKKVTAEFDKLPNSRVAVVVWTDPSTLFDYPYARLELATFVNDKLTAELTQRELGTDVVAPREVEDFLQKTPSAQIDPVKVGRQFRTDYVVYVEVSEFQFRDPDSPQLLQGRIGASVSVYDVRSEREKPNRFSLAPVECVFPEGSPVLMNASNSMYIREATYQQFAEQVARKFYEYTVEL